MPGCSSFLRRALRVSAAALVLGLLAFVSAIPAAQAVSTVVKLQCVGTQSVTFDPPLTNTQKPTKVGFTENLTTCLLGGVASGMSAGNAMETTSWREPPTDPARPAAGQASRAGRQGPQRSVISPE